MDTIQNQVKDALNKRGVRKNIYTSSSFLEHGKLPPGWIRGGCIGCFNARKNTLNAVIDILKPESFFTKKHIKKYLLLLSIYFKKLNLLTF